MLPHFHALIKRYPRLLPRLKTLIVCLGCAGVRSRTWRQAWTRIMKAIGLAHV
ncbi:MAG: hypothetical protein ACRERE_44910 [Candidatus Entotheonellia bacterium]